MKKDFRPKLFINELIKRIQSSRKSFKFQLIVSFVLISILPLFIIQSISAYTVMDAMRENINEIISLNLLQTRKSLDLTLTDYNDFLFQIYTSDAMVENMSNINDDHEVAVNTNQLRRNLRSFSNAKPNVQCITVITSSGKLIAYDKLTPVTFESSWLNEEKEARQLYEMIATNNETTMIETGNATQFGVNPYYLFHQAHRMIDYKNIYKDVGVVIISMDESVLAEACNEEESGDTPLTSINFIVDETGKLLSFPNRDYIGQTIDIENERALRRLLRDSEVLAGNRIMVHSLKDDVSGWTIINASDQTSFYRRLNNQQRLIIITGLITALALVLIIFPISKRLSGSITRVVRAMNRAGTGELTARVKTDEHMPLEIKTVADHFNNMMMKIGLLVEEVREATFKQKEAEIRALESQINPHFLYNTLDTINWMAIDKDEHEISSMINSLGKILRYGVDKSNAIVTLREEVEWLRQYIFLQQTRLKNAFECKLNIDESIMRCKIHKLLLQPFVENSIMHGFYGKKGRCVLTISIKNRGDFIELRIEDNGVGMSKEMVDCFNNRLCDDRNAKHIGIQNVQSRLDMYYGDDAKLHIKSDENGTCITLKIAKAY